MTILPEEFWITNLPHSIGNGMHLAFYDNTRQEGLSRYIRYSCYEALEDKIYHLSREIEEFKYGIQNFRCPSCKNISGPFYPVNLMTELNETKVQCDKLVDALILFSDPTDCDARTIITEYKIWKKKK